MHAQSARPQFVQLARAQIGIAGRTFDVVVLPHPSGRSTWLNKPENMKLLKRSLKLIAPYLLRMFAIR